MRNDQGLEQILDDTRLAILAGDFKALAELAERCEAFLSGGLARNPAELGRIAAKAERNATLLKAASRGVAAARRRARELAEGGRFSTYDAAGRRGQLTDDQAAPARRL